MKARNTVVFSLKIRRRRWLTSAQGSSLREPWDQHIKGVLTLKGFGYWRTLTGCNSIFKSRDLGRVAGDTAINDRRIDYVFGPPALEHTGRVEVLRNAAVGRMDHWPSLVEVDL
jgi:hypothetical protein